LVYVIIGLVLLIIIAPIISVLPSARQKEQMVMRKSAREAGISVELTSIDDPNPDQEKYVSHIGKKIPAKLKVAGYRIQRRRIGDWRRLPAVNWCLEKKFEDGWQWTETSQSMSGVLKRFLDEEVPKLPDDVEQVEESDYNIVVYWRERTKGSEGNVLDFLKRCAELALREPDKNENDDSPT
jgi:hypothetical protein